MLTNKKKKLSYEILIIVGISLLISFFVFLFVLLLSNAIIEEYLFNNNIILDDYEMYQIDNSIFIISLIISLFLFLLLFLISLNKKINYIKIITNEINNLENHNYDNKIIIKGNNELTDLAKSINLFMEKEKEIKEKEIKLNKEKEELTRNLSHDIRTPLTSIISYTELMSNKENINLEQKEYYSLVLKKAKQIKELTNILLDNKRELIYFEDVSLLFKQLAEDFNNSLENDFKLDIDFSLFNKFSYSFDTNELIRIFDNLITNIQKYADNHSKVELKFIKENNKFIIIQKNTIKKLKNDVENNNIGINSIKKIVQNYEGNVVINKNETKYEIIISFPISN